MKWYQLKGVWSSAVTIVATAAGALGVAIAPEVQDQIVNSLVLAATGIGGLVSLAIHIMDGKKGE